MDITVVVLPSAVVKRKLQLEEDEQGALSDLHEIRPERQKRKRLSYKNPKKTTRILEYIPLSGGTGLISNG